MIYLFAGDDTERKLLVYQKFLKELPKGIATFRIEKSNFSPVEVESFSSGAGLFFKDSAIIFSGLLEYAEARDFLLEKLEKMRVSNNYFIFLEGKLTKPVLDPFRKVRAELNIFEKNKDALEKYNNFLLANALGKKDKLSLWIYFRQAMRAGVSAEELSGVLFWKTKDMILKRNFSRFREAELVNLAGGFSSLLPEARRDGRDAEIAFERYILEAI